MTQARHQTHDAVPTKGRHRLDLLRAASATEAEFIANQEMLKYGTPIEYILGYVEIGGAKFRVDRRVYIPNQESAALLDAALADLVPGKVVLDIGTGCGWLAILMKRHMPSARVLATDIEQGALDLARANAAQHGAEIEFFRSSLGIAVALDTAPDMIVANLPYGEARHALEHEGGSAHAHLPVTSTFPQGGALSLYSALLDAMAERGWAAPVYCEIGLVEDEVVMADLGRPGRSIAIRRRGGHGVAVITAVNPSA